MDTSFQHRLRKKTVHEHTDYVDADFRRHIRCGLSFGPPRRQNDFCKLKIMISERGRGARRRQKARYFSKWTLLQWRRREFSLGEMYYIIHYFRDKSQGSAPADIHIRV